MSNRNSVNPASQRNSLQNSTNEPYDAIIAHYAKEGSADMNEQSPESDQSFDESRSTSFGKDTSARLPGRIADTSPEPEESLEKHSQLSKEGCDAEARCEDYEVRVVRLKKICTLFALVTAALGVALLGTLVGLIFLAATRNRTANLEPDLSNSDLPLPTLRETSVLTMEFEKTDNTDPDIAKVFADHSLYQSFYGVNYGELETLDCSARDLQHDIARDMALLSRVTQRVRILGDECNLTDRILNAILDIKVNIAVVLNVRASEWSVRGPEIRRILASYPRVLFDSVLIERDDSPVTSYRAYSELESFFKHKSMEDIPIRLVDLAEKQPNPLSFASDPNTTRAWVTNDKARQVYTNLESPAETSEKARAMAVWVCGVSDYLDPTVAWFWSRAFDTTSGLKNGIFTIDRELKPAGLPRCADYV